MSSVVAIFKKWIGNFFRYITRKNLVSACKSGANGGLQKMEKKIKKYSILKTDKLSYATVSDFNDSVQNFPSICGLNGDLKNVQRPWVIKAILANVPLGGKLLEIGGGEPLAAKILTQLGYGVTIVDPYDGTANGPTEYAYYKAKYKNIKLIRKYFKNDVEQLKNKKFDCIYSISVLEHVPDAEIESLFDTCKKYITKNGHFIHAIDHVFMGNGQQAHEDKLRLMLQQLSLDSQLDILFDTIRNDVDAYFMSAEGHLFWKGQIPYHRFPFRRVVSIHICAPANEERK